VDPRSLALWIITGQSVLVGTLRLLLVAASVVASVGCGDDAESSGDDDGADEPYALLSDDAWVLQEAVDPPADDPISSIERPPLDWYAEYVRSSPTESQMVRLSGHRTTFDDARTELEDVGFAFDVIEVDGRRSVGGSAAGDPAGPAVVLLETGSTSLMVLSYELEVDDLAELADAIEAVDETTWVNAGGVLG
jgi:hypothetical protein